MHPSPYCRGVHGAPDQSQSGWQIRALDPVFRQYGVDAVLSSHDHMVERCLTGPAGYEEAMDDTASANLNYFVMGNSGKSAREAADGARLAAPVGDRRLQTLARVTRRGDEFIRQELGGCRFVDLIGEHGW